MFLVDHYQYDLNPVVQLSCDHYFEKRDLSIPDDQDLISKEQEGYLVFKQRGIMDEQFFSGSTCF
jgi:hypothetical protein